MIRPRHLFTLATAVLLIGPVRSQTMFIPDTYLRGWLNAAKPGSVDVNGNCDTVAWNAVPPTDVIFSFGQAPDFSTIDLEGIQYLKMSRVHLLDVTLRNLTVLWPGYPRANTFLEVNYLDIDLINGILPFPATLDRFECDDCELDSFPTSFQGTYLTLWDLEIGEIPEFPPDLYFLYLKNCGISSLPPFPEGMNSILVADDSLDAIPTLPESLLNFTGTNVGIPDIPEVNAGLGVLTWTRNGTTTIPPLPDITQLNVSGNNITSLANLPADLWTLDADDNPITALANLPNSIANLHCDSCPLISIDAFPEMLEYASFEAAQLSTIPPLPSGLLRLNLRNCSQLDCLPVLPQTLEYLYLYNSGISCLPNIPPDLSLTGGQYNLGIAPILCDITNSPCPLIDPLVTGTVFTDANNNAWFDGGEFARPNAVVQAMPGGHLAGSNWNGDYILPLDIGSFTVDGQPTPYEGTTGGPFEVTFTALGEVDSLNDIGYEVVPGIYDLVSNLEVVPTRPGFTTTLWYSVHNVGTEATNAAVALTFDNNLAFVESDYAPSSQNGNVIEWSTGLLYPGASWTVTVTLNAPSSLPIGTPIAHQATGTPDAADISMWDNTALLNDITVGSYDPNDKRVEPSTLSPQHIIDGRRVEYTIRFQNTGTYPAERVLITDTLSSDLQWVTMQEIASSHDHNWFIRDGALHVLFENINLPDSTSDEPHSHGFITFSMKPAANLMLGESVGNTANIYFDFNEPVITNEAVFTVDATAAMRETQDAIWTVWPNPANDVLRISGPLSSVGIAEVIDISGKTLLRSSLNTTKSEIDLHPLVGGTYILRITSSETVHTTKFSRL